MNNRGIIQCGALLEVSFVGLRTLLIRDMDNYNIKEIFIPLDLHSDRIDWFIREAIFTYIKDRFYEKHAEEFMRATNMALELNLGPLWLDNDKIMEIRRENDRDNDAGKGSFNLERGVFPFAKIGTEALDKAKKRNKEIAKQIKRMNRQTELKKTLQ